MCLTVLTCRASDTEERVRGIQRKAKGKEGAAGRDVNGGNVPDLLSYGS